MRALRRVAWNLRRYVFRRDFFRKVRARVRAARRRAQRNEFDDLAFVYSCVHSSPEVIFDVGANIGLVTSRLRRLFPSAAIHAFEPTEHTGATLRDRLGHDEQVTIVSAAVSDTVGIARFNVDNKTHAGGSNSLLGHSIHFATRARVDRYAEVDVPCTTLDAYASEGGLEHLDILKLDIEGAELLALKGAVRLLRDQAIDFVATEIRFIPDYEGQPLFADLIGYLEEFGYSVFNVYSPAESGVRQALFGNALFISERMREELSSSLGPRVCGFAVHVSSAPAEQS